jgi:hypothetical protein
LKKFTVDRFTVHRLSGVKERTVQPEHELEGDENKTRRGRELSTVNREQKEARTKKI